LPIQPDLSLIGTVKARHDREQSRFPRSVRTDDPKQAAGLDVQVDAIEGSESPEGFADVANLKAHRFV
jgi:hypothetical protein